MGHIILTAWLPEWLEGLPSLAAFWGLGEPPQYRQAGPVSCHSRFPALGPSSPEPKLIMSLPSSPIRACGGLCGPQKEDILLSLASKSLSAVACRPLPQHICLSRTGLLVAPQTHLTLGLL